MNRADIAISFVLLLCTMTGCGPSLHQHHTVTLEVGEISVFVLDAVGVEQTIRVTAKSPSAPVSVYVYLNENDAEVERKITLGKPSDLILSSAEKSEEIAIEAKIPANQEAAVRIMSASRETANVDLTITN